MAISTIPVHHLNPLTIVGLIFGGVLLFILLLILGARFEWWKKLRGEFVYKFHGTKALRVLMIHRNKQLTDYVVTYDVNKTFNWLGAKYIVEPQTFFYKKHRACALYHEGNPNPISIELDKVEAKLKMDAETFKEVMNQKLIKDLFVEGKEQLLIVIVLILTVLNILLQIAIKSGMLDKVAGGGK